MNLSNNGILLWYVMQKYCKHTHIYFYVWLCLSAYIELYYGMSLHSLMHSFNVVFVVCVIHGPQKGVDYSIFS
jgi:hypothetical protein